MADPEGVIFCMFVIVELHALLCLLSTLGLQLSSCSNLAN